MGDLLNSSHNEEYRRHLRKQSSPAEALLWRHLRGKRLGEFKFRRQYGIGRYIADFCCPGCRVIIELDGPSHHEDEAAICDAQRQHYLEAFGYMVVRFRNDQVRFQLESVLENILHLCEERRKMDFQKFHQHL